MSRAPLVSVIVPCYNAAAWIGETLQSALAQDVQVELILVDDGSQDDSVAIARRAAGSELRVFHQQHGGASRARNLGTLESRGMFLQYLDADDLLVPNTLGAKVATLMRLEADVVYTNWVRWERQMDGSFAQGALVARTLGDRPDVELFVDAWWPPGALLYRRTLVEKIAGWREDLPVIQDARFLFDAALHGARFAHLDAVAMKYRVVGDSLSKRNPRAFVDDCYTNTRDVHARWMIDGDLDDERRRALIKAYANLARWYFEFDRGRFAEILATLRLLDPVFLPERPRSLRALSRVVGYERAEHIALTWRTLKGSVRRRATGNGEGASHA